MKFILHRDIQYENSFKLLFDKLGGLKQKASIWLEYRISEQEFVYKIFFGANSPEEANKNLIYWPLNNMDSGALYFVKRLKAIFPDLRIIAKKNSKLPETFKMLFKKRVKSLIEDTGHN